MITTNAPASVGTLNKSPDDEHHLVSTRCQHREKGSTRLKSLGPGLTQIDVMNTWNQIQRRAKMATDSNPFRLSRQQ